MSGAPGQASPSQSALSRRSSQPLAGQANPSQATWSCRVAHSRFGHGTLRHASQVRLPPTRHPETPILVSHACPDGPARKFRGPAVGTAVGAAFGEEAEQEAETRDADGNGSPHCSGTSDKGSSSPTKHRQPPPASPAHKLVFVTYQFCRAQGDRQF